MRAYQKVLYRGFTLESPRTNGPDPSPSFPAAPLSGNSVASSSTIQSPNPDIMYTHIQNSTGLPHLYKRKQQGLASCRSYSYSTPSSARATTELGGTSADVPHKSPSKITALPEGKEIISSDLLGMGTESIDSNISATEDSSTARSSTPSSVSMDMFASLPQRSALKIETFDDPPLTHLSILSSGTKGAGVPGATRHGSIPRTPSPPSFSSSSSSDSSEHSSYSVTRKSVNPSISERQNLKRRSIRSSSRVETRTASASLRPIGPAHLEHDYTIARRALSTAVAIACYELFGFSIPVRNTECEERRPGKDALPMIRAHPMVRKAARAVDAADVALENALSRGETLENTEIPDEWRWGSEMLRPYEWARLGPEPIKEVKRRRTETYIAEQLDEKPRTRNQKRNAGAEEADTCSRECTIKHEDEVTSDILNLVSSDPTQVSSSSTMATVPRPNTIITIKIKPFRGTNTPLASSSIPTLPSSSIAPVASGPDKRKRGRPRKNPMLSEPSSSSTTIVEAASEKRRPGRPRKLPLLSPLPPPNTFENIVAPEKRRRGRPRKRPFLPSSSTSQSITTAVEAMPIEHPSKRQRIL